MLRCEGVSKSYGSRSVLRDLDLVVTEGTLTAILGASGSGKTTLLRVIMGFASADAGAVRIGSQVVEQAGRVHVAPDKRAIGYVAQEGALFPHLTAGENVAFGLDRGARKRGSRVAEVLSLVGLGREYVARHPHELSGGEQRRVALARALAPRPRLVLLDEPFNGLDASLRAETREAVLSALAGEGATALLVTHDQAEALSVGREVAVLRDGHLVQRGAPTAVYRTPVDREVARFVGEAVLLPGAAAAGRVMCALGNLAVADGGAEGDVEVMIRPEQIRLTRLGRETGGPTFHGVRAEVLGHTYYGPDKVVDLRLEDGSVVRARTLDPDVPGRGEAVGLVVFGEVVAFPASGPSRAGVVAVVPSGLEAC